MMMNNKAHLTEQALLQIAHSAGLDVDKLKTDMSDPSLTDIIQNNINLGRQAGVRVTPSFIVGGYFYPGYAQYAELKQRVDYARSMNGAQ